MGKTIGEMTQPERDAAIKHAASLFQEELTRNAGAIGEVLDGFCVTETTPALRIITAYGLPGYGPDASDGNFGVHSTWPDAGDELRRMLAESADGLADVADSEAEAGNYETAWNTRKHADAMYDVHANLNNERATAPLYAGHPALWASTVEQIIGEYFPYDVNPGCRIYCWVSADFGLDECPCCKRMTDLGDVLCGECEEAGCGHSDYATPSLPYPYCAATDSSPLV